MSEYYEFVGSLTFRSAKDASEGHRALRAVHDGVTTFFWVPPDDPDEEPVEHTDLVVDGATLRFDWKGFTGGVEPYYKTRSVLEQLVKKAVFGRVGLREGEDGRVEWFGYRRGPKVAAKKTAAKKTAVKKTSAKKPAVKTSAAKRSATKTPVAKKSSKKSAKRR